MEPNDLSGVGVALVTPFSEGSIDYTSLAKVISHCLNGGVDYFVSLGSTGEASLLSESEQRSVLDFTIDQNAGRLPIVAGNFGISNTNALCRKVSNYDFRGIDAILINSPAYLRPSQEGIYKHYMAASEVCEVPPILIYNIPSRTSSNVRPETVNRLAESSSKFIGIKEASGQSEQWESILKQVRSDFLVISGDDSTSLALLRRGGHGVISVIANAFPRVFSQMTKAGLAKNFDLAEELSLSLHDIHPLLYVEGNPSGIKGALELMDLCKREVRLPLTELSAQNFERLRKIIEKIGPQQ